MIGIGSNKGRVRTMGLWKKIGISGLVGGIFLIFFGIGDLLYTRDYFYRHAQLLYLPLFTGPISIFLGLALIAGGIVLIIVMQKKGKGKKRFAVHDIGRKKGELI